MDNTEELLRSALKENAAAITPDSLRHRGPVTLRPSRIRSVAVVAAAFVVAAGVVTGAAVLNGRDGGQMVGAESRQDAYVGYQWRLRSVAKDQVEHEVPAEVGATVSFYSNGDVVMQDGVNALFGRYEGSAAALQLRDVGRTYAVYGGDDPVRLMVIDAVHGLTSGTMRLSTADDRLTITTATHLLVLDRGDALPDGPSAPPPSR